jgi:sensor c-di-GMP phosphodiesterase-like protein
MGAALGSISGSLLGHYVGLQQAEDRLTQQADNILVQEETYSNESRALLALVNASTYPRCSDAEVAWFRSLIYQSEYIKDVGHIQEGRLECSALLGREGAPSQRIVPRYIRWDGSRIFVDPAPLKPNAAEITAVQIGGAFIVYSPFRTKYFDLSPLHYTIKPLNAPAPMPIEVLGGATYVDSAVPSKDGFYRLHGRLLAVRCSSRFINCVTTYLSTNEALGLARNLWLIYTGAGCLFGSCVGLIASLLYRRGHCMIGQLRRALCFDRIRVVYQPIVNLASGCIVEAEALLRWTDEDGSTVSPDVFVRIAEECGLIGDLTRFVVRRVLQEFGPYLRSNPGFCININVTATDLADPNFLPMLEMSIANADVAPQQLAIEITEGSTTHRHIAMETIRQLRERGHSVQIDDFGTGYSSLSYLRDLSIDTLKIDRSFTQSIGTNSVTVCILPQIMAMAQALHLRVIVEGVESSAQADYFKHYDLPLFAQGWLFGRPVPAHELMGQLNCDESIMQELGTPWMAPTQRVSDLGE